MNEAVSDLPILRTLGDFLSWIEDQDQRFEFENGRLVAMTGGSIRHAHLFGNLTTTLGNALRQQDCTVYTADACVAFDDDRYGYFPDLVISCNEEAMDAIRQPVVIVEVLSPSSERRDRGEKWHRYRRLPSLRHYLLVAQDQVSVDHYFRRADQQLWSFEGFEALDDIVTLGAVNATLPLSEIYRRIRLDDEDQAPSS